MGMEKIELASVIFKKNHVIQLQLKKDNVILKVDRQGFPMIPKTRNKINFIMEIIDVKTISHFRSRTLYNHYREIESESKTPSRESNLPPCAPQARFGAALASSNSSGLIHLASGALV